VLKRYLNIIFLLVVVCSSAYGQQFPIYSQYWTNKFLLNPAIAGHEGYTSFNLTARKQWAGLEGSPSTVAVSGQTRFIKSSHISKGRGLFKSNRRGRGRRMSKGGKVGYGGYIFNDNLGALTKTGFQGTYSYHLSLRKSALSFGGSLVGLQYSINRDKIRLEDSENDIFFDNTANRGYFLDGNFGVYYSDKNFYAGFSAQNLFESFFFFNKSDSGSQIRLERQYIVMSGYRYDVIDFVYLEPSFNLKFSENVVSQVDINLSAYFHENYWGGIGYRSGSTSRVSTETLGGKGSSLILYGGARIDKFFVGYSFDYTFSSLQRNTFGSHEIMMAVRFGDNARRYRWLNRY